MNEIYMPKENIIFRGMSLANGEWEYGFVNVGINGCWIGTTAFPTAVDRETVGQWSGLRDRQGVPIYEGDILTGLTRWNMDYTVTCVFENGAFGAEWYHNDYRHFMPFACFYGVEWEVVGNKWEDEK